MKARIIPALLAAGGLALLTAAPSTAGVSWFYSGNVGPTHWADYYPTCAGKAQSPIDLASAAMTPASIIQPQVGNVKGVSELINNGHSVEAEAVAGTTLTTRGETRPLLQIHFHRPSEHTVNGVSYPVEVHFVSKGADGQLSVLGVFLKAGKSKNKAWESYAHETEELQSNGQTGEATIDYAKLLPSTTKMYQYEGSLTTPPCTEGVHWNVAATPVKVSKKQLSWFQDVILWQAPDEASNRPVQPLNGRVIQTNVG